VDKDLVSVIMPAHNSEESISIAIESVLAQSYPNWELIVVDDVSSDQTRSIVETFAKRDARVSLVALKEHHGPALARNVGIERAVGRYIAFLDSDDAWLPCKLDEQLTFMRENSLCFTFTSYFMMDENGLVIGEYLIKEEVSFEDLLNVNYVGCSTAVYDAVKLGKRYMKPVRHEDYVLWLQILKEIGFTKGLTKPLVVYRVGSKGISSSKWKSASWRWHVYRSELQMGTFDSLRYFVVYVWNGLVKFGKFRFQKRSSLLSTNIKNPITVEQLIFGQAEKS